MVNIAAVERATTHLAVAIDVDSDPITGFVSDGMHGSQPFRGWVELVAAIEAVRSSRDPRADMGDSETQTLGLFPGANAPEL
jgi:hypothetical protein